MIKKSVFENDLISGMERELHAQHTQQAKAGVVQAVDHLQSAADILRKAGLVSRAKAIDSILEKLSQHKKTHQAHEMPPMRDLMLAGVTQHDFMEFSKGNPVAKAKINLALRELGRTDKEIIHFIGKNNFLSEKDAHDLLDPNRNLGKMWEWMQNPSTPIDPSNLQPGEELTMTSLPAEAKLVEEVPSQLSMKSLTPKHEGPASPEDEVAFKSLAQAFNDAEDEADARAGKKHKIPHKVNDPHTKGLTPDKMVENYKRHGIPFNMSDDGLLDVEVADDQLEVQDGDLNSEMDFEDEI